ncbi:MAG: Resolvase domain protein [Candidatus Woesebacteria bacterium GW2011_GWA1_37_8]|uniref:Resolvase domain protein n=2 Tax=Candidatus Woeseibacteriota TaxID=1752722 RepID=A0A0G0L603_9BACT|nr:MAG: Resolvase domain protein [Candidatus Woesebacteria bacterium GW2011_GWA1_37_8]KKQ87448.1 MAG: Resolvase domain protein [Candidatus Woesebacteria bacterium GW2011_GWB1_38_8b]
MDDKTLNLLSIGEASEYLGVSIDTLRRWEKKGKLASYRSPGGHRYFKKNELDEMFGKKYERTEETTPRKEYETSTAGQEKPNPEEEIEDVRETVLDDNSEAQEAVDSILTETQVVRDEIESFFDRQPKNIEIPKLSPIRVKPYETNSVTTATAGAPAVQEQTTPQPKLFSSFSQLGGNGGGDKKSKNQISQNILIIVAGVVLICALAFVVIYFATKPQIISPV